MLRVERAQALLVSATADHLHAHARSTCSLERQVHPLMAHELADHENIVLRLGRGEAPKLDRRVDDRRLDAPVPRQALLGEA